MNCEKCKTRECEYIELEMFLKYVSEYCGKNFEICECPDKSNTGYTCDFVVKDHASQEKMYVEIKEVKFGFEGENSFNTAIAEENGQIKYAECFSRVLKDLEDEKRKRLNDFTIKVPKEQISKSESNAFCEKAKEFINKTSFQEDKYEFVYERKKVSVTFLFERKSKETREKYGDNLLFAYESEKENMLHNYVDRLTDLETLEKLLKENVKKIIEKKFPQTKDRKILLNILKIPVGSDVFFERNAEAMFGQIASRAGQYVSDEYESYLLYYSDDFIKTEREDGKVTVRQLGKMLFIIPLAGGLVQERIAYGEMPE